MRGIDYLQVPTTLMAQVDSSIGGKTAVNLPEGKNLVGAFHQPRLVLADTDALRSLPRREYRAGWAEVVKHALIADADFFALLEAIADPLAELDSLCVAHAVRRSCEIKIDVVRRDERETGLRAVLNCGHTIAHALESTAAYGHLRHGEAVAIGLAAETQLAARRGMASGADASRVEALLLALGLPVHTPVPDMDAALAASKLDKKRLAGKMRMALPLGIGGVETVDDVALNEIRDALAYIAR
jgi:3-dehydroquinate synthase